MRTPEQRQVPSFMKLSSMPTLTPITASRHLHSENLAMDQSFQTSSPARAAQNYIPSFESTRTVYRALSNRPAGKLLPNTVAAVDPSYVEDKETKTPSGTTIRTKHAWTIGRVKKSKKAKYLFDFGALRPQTNSHTNCGQQRKQSRAAPTV